MQPIARNHIAVFGNTLRLIQSEPSVDRKKQLEDLERIKGWMHDNTEELRAMNEHAKNPNSYYKLFNREREMYHRIFILHHQRDRIYKVWDMYLEKMKFYQY